MQVRRDPGLLQANLQSPGAPVPTEATERTGARPDVGGNLGSLGLQALPLQVLHSGTCFCVDKDKSCVEGTGFLLHDFKRGLQSCAE